jgi:hypothetical protein
MNKILLSITLLCSVLFANSQINIQWESRYDMNNAADFSRGVVIDAAGNSYVTGTANNGSNFDIVTVKYDPNGNQLWSHTYNGTFGGWDDARGLRLDSQGNVLVGGFTQTGLTDYDFVALKINGLNGGQMWAYVHPGSANFDECRAVEIDGNDNFIITGARENSSTAHQFMTVSLNTNGVPNWSNTFPASTSTRHVANAITIDENNDVFIAGESWGGASNLDFRVLKLNGANGAQAWTNTYDGNGLIDVPKSIAVDADDNVIVTGTCYINVTIEEEITTVKFNSAGAFQWAQQYGGTALTYDTPNYVTTDNLNNVYVAGRVRNLGNGEDFFIGKYSPAGNLEWDYVYQSPTNGYDEAMKVLVNDDLEIYASGFSHLTQSSHDYITVRLDQNGDEVWFTRFDGPASASDQMSDFVLDQSGNLFVTGSSVGTGTNRDYSTIKYCQLNTLATQDLDTICVGESVQLNATGGFGHTWSLISGDPIAPNNFTCTSCTNPVATPNETSVYLVTSQSTSGCVDTDTVTIVVNPLPGPTISSSGPTTFCDGGTVILTADPADVYDWNTGASTQSIVADTSGIYSLTVTDNMGCQNFTNIEVIVNPNPVIDGGNDRFRCPGIALTFNAQGADSLAWFAPPNYNDPIANGEPFIPTVGGQYIVIGIDANGCTGQDEVNVTIFPPAFQIELEQGMSGNLFVNTTQPTTEWFLDGSAIGHTGFSFFYDEEPYCNGVYSVIHTDENGCQSFDTLEVTDASCENDTSNVSNQYLQNFNVYPNPTSGKFFIDFESTQRRTIKVYSIQGKLVHEMEQTGISYVLDLDNQNSGTYILLIQEGSYILHSKIIKQ